MYDLIVNPFSGKKGLKKEKKGVYVVEKRLKERSISYSLHFTERKGHATELTRQLCESGATDIIVIGGDGTLHEVVNGFTNFDKVNLGIIPCGTGNDFATALGIPLNPKDAIDLILDGSPKFTDFMQMPTVRGINIIGMGIDVDVLNYYNALKKKTRWGYTKCLIKALCKFNYLDFNASIDGGEMKEYKSFIACVANGYRYGGGIPIAPPAIPYDNKLDFVVVDEMKKLKIIYAFLQLKKGNILKIKEGHHQTLTKCVIDVPKPYYINVDGELYKDIPFEVEIVSNKLKVYRNDKK